MDMDCIIGRMVGGMKACGRMESKMERASTFCLMELLK